MEDDAFLTPEEAATLRNSALVVRRASGAARRVARQLTARLGIKIGDIIRDSGGAPRWPEGIVGSLSHDGVIAGAIVAKSGDLGGLGIDVEPPEYLEDGIARLVANYEERKQFDGDPFAEKALFSIKEAVFKAVHPCDHIFLDFLDVRVDRKTQTAETFYGRVVNWRVLTEPHVVSIAWWS